MKSAVKVVKDIKVIVVILFLAVTAKAQSDTMYVFHTGSPVYKRALSQIDSVIFYKAPGTVTDNDGNIYQTIQIGNQTWMTENLKVRHYRNGDPIPNITDTAVWSTDTTGAFCWYSNDSSNNATYGCMYNWYAVADTRNIAPVGWHVPDDAEWTTLVNYLGNSNVAGGKMKETGTAHWFSPNTGATNESGFTALPGGYRYTDNGSFRQTGYDGDWWSTTEEGGPYAWFRNIYYNSATSGRYYYKKQNGFSVRCLMDGK
jgi:uncharacterized protein (TIGR02145 family)